MRKMENMVAVKNVKCIEFREKNTYDEYFITIKNKFGCSSIVIIRIILSLFKLKYSFKVGQYTGVRMDRTVTLLAPDCLSDGIIMHELLHTLGNY